MTADAVHTVRIEGLFKTITPTHISDVATNLRYEPSTGRVSRGARSGFPVAGQRTLTYRMPDGEGEDLGYIQVPILPANGLRGRLRRAGAAEVEDALVARGLYLTWQAYQAMHCGAVTGTPDGSAPPLDEVRSIRNHLFMGLFGGGNRMTPSRLRVSTALPVLQGLIDLGAIPDAYADAAIPTTQWRRLMETLPIVRRDDLAQHLDPRAEDVVADYDSVMHEQFLLDTARRAARVRAASPSNADETVPEDPPRGLRALSAIQVITPGTPFYVRFDARCTEAQAGLLVHALLRILRQENNGLGGKSALGYGRFTHALSLSLDSKTVDPFLGQFEETRLQLNNTLMGRLADAFERELELIDPVALDALVMAKRTPEEEKALPQPTSRKPKSTLGAA